MKKQSIKPKGKTVKPDKDIEAGFRAAEKLINEREKYLTPIKWRKPTN